MTDESEKVPAPDQKEQHTPEPQQGPPPLKPEDVRTLGELRQLLFQTDQGLVAWAQKRIQETQYTDAVKGELVLHRTDMLIFGMHKIIEINESLERRVLALENILNNALIQVDNDHA